MEHTGVDRDTQIVDGIDALLLSMDSRDVNYIPLLSKLYMSRPGIMPEYQPTKKALIDSLKNACLEKEKEVGSMIILSGTVCLRIHKQLLKVIVNVLMGVDD
jgi:hypothetical protein